MGVKAKGKHRLDKYYHLAKEQGLRSRASFKLIQLDAKFSLLNSSRSILDLCAAPGGWMQIAVKYAPVGSLVVGVDLFPIRPIHGAIAVEEDITKPKCRATIKRLLSENGYKAFDLVLHDGSPNVGGAWAQEATSQNALVIDSVKLATEFLAPKGTFVTKVFRSQDYSAVLYCLKQFFEKVEVTKPAASRSTSAEIYVIGLRYKAPAKIDPRLLDFKHLFQGATDPQKVIDVLRGTKQKRHRDGYEDGQALVRKIRSASEFVWSDSPVEMLGTTTSISFDGASSLPLKEHDLTTEEVVLLCEDLSVLGKQDFKNLLKWRFKIRKALSAGKAISEVETAKEEGDVVKEELDEEEKILTEMSELQHVVDRKKKREKKVLAKRRAKDKARKATGMQKDATLDGYVDNDLFALTSIKGKEDLATVDTTDVEAEDWAVSEDDADNKAKDHSESSDDLDSDEERERYDEQLERILDDAYEQFVSKKDGSTKQRKRAKKAYADEFLGDAEDTVEPDEDSDKEQGDQEANPLVVPIDTDGELTQEEIKQMWFSHDVFVDAVEKGDLGKDDSDDEALGDGRRQKVPLPSKTSKPIPIKSRSDTVKRSSGKVQDDIEIVPAPATDSSDSSSSDDESDYDTDTKAEIRALGKKMLGGKRKRQELEDMAYHKRTFDDHTGSLPVWFLEDERKFNQPPKLVTKEELRAEKALFKEIDARPAKKVAEAKARKKRAAMRNLEKIRKKANSISDQTDIPDRSKTRMIEQLYKKATPRKPKKEFVVAKKGVQVRPGKGKVLVDRRMKKDARQQGMTKNGKGKGKTKGNGKGKGKGKGKPTGKTGKGNRG